MKNYNNKISAILVSASIALFSFSAEAKSQVQLTPGPGMQQMMQQKQSIINNLSGSSLTSLALTNASTSTNPHIKTRCNYSLSTMPVNVSYASSYLGFIIYHGTVTPYPMPAYDLCLAVARDTCNFLTYAIGIPGQIDVDFDGNIVQGTKRCGTF